MRKEGKTNFKNIKKRGENYNEEAENRSESIGPALFLAQKKIGGRFTLYERNHCQRFAYRISPFFA
jgi:hypothetical protein